MADTIKKIFCAAEQAITNHTLVLSSDGKEIVATCGCERFIKFPATTTEEFNELVAKHEAANKGQITQEALQEKLTEIVGPSDEAVEDEA